MWKKLVAAAALAALLATPSLAQTNPGLTQGQKLTPAQWNNLFASKQDTLGYTPLNTAGGVMSGRLVTAAPGASTAGLNLTPGTAPASPSDGDMWATSSGFYARVNGVTIGPLSGGTSSSFAATSPITVSFPSGVVTFACPTCGVTGSPLSQFAATTSAQLRGILSDETGAGLAVFNDTPTLITPVLGVATATSINKVAITAPATSATLTIANGKTLTASNSLTFTGTDGTFFGFPGTSDTVVTLAATQSPTNKTITGSTNVLGNVTMTLGSDATGDLYYRNSGGQLTRLAIGSGSQVLTVSGGLPTWQAGSSAGSVTAGTTTIAGTCSTQQQVYNNAGTLSCANLSSFLSAGTGISLSGTTTVTINNTGVTSVSSGYGLTGTVTTTGSLAVSLSTITNSLSGDVAVGNGSYTDGPSVAQGSTGTWFASGTVVFNDTSGAGAQVSCKLWDGTTVIASMIARTVVSGQGQTACALSGYLASPAGNLRISASTSNGSTSFKFNMTGNSKDSTLSAFRIQ